MEKNLAAFCGAVFSVARMDAFPKGLRYTLIDRQHQLDLALTQLSSQPRLAVDTESSGYFTYFSNLCLIQISAGNLHYIIDPLAPLKLDALGGIFLDPSIEIIFHAAASDVQELKRAYGWEFRGVFDTFYACRLLTGKSCSLASLVKKYKGMDLEKKEQKSNWQRRPLSQSQLDYAHLDTLYLEEIRDALARELESLGLMPEFEAECRFIESRPLREDRPFDPESWVRIKGALEEEPEVRGRIRALFVLRDKVARKTDTAAFRLISNDAMLRLARTFPRDKESLLKFRGANARFLKKEAERILKAIQEASPVSDSELPRSEGQSPAVIGRFRTLKKRRQEIADYRGMKPALVASNKALQALAEAVPKSLSEIEDLDILNPWKIEMYGPQFLLALRGEPLGTLPASLPILPVEYRHK